ncbi:MAG TPA: tetratricopeptide repeat protein [Gemmatimonadaceae bacterium]|nr:tetratricopeptide repeat protein [Gemmatimonadaceae bacterium]
MNRRVAATLGVSVLVVAGGWLGARRVGAFEPSAARPGSGEPAAMSEITQRDTQIRVWTTALQQDPQSAIALTQLSGLYLQRARETGDDNNYVQAEQYARRSLALRVNRNGPAFVTLTAALVAQHRFHEAEQVARDLVEFDPSVPQYRAQLGEIQMELGDYAAARQSFDSLYGVRTHLSIAARLARWAEVNGNTAYARKLLSDALDEAHTRRNLPKEQLAWFYLRLGDIDLRNGRLRSARAMFQKGLEIEPGDYRLLDEMAHLEAMAGNPKKTIEYGERASAAKFDPGLLGTIGEAYATLGDDVRAEDYFRRMETAARAAPGGHDRGASMFLLDRNRRIPEVLANAQKEIETRKDIYGYDLVAWALHKAGRNAEARAAMNEARRLGTRDAVLFYHAGMIELALGDAPRARHSLSEALKVNPSFDPTQARDARAVLDSLDRELGR